MLGGSDFVALPDQQPRVSLGDKAFDAVASDCQPVADGQGAQRCATLTVTVPKGALAAGAYPLVVQNPGASACTRR